MSTNQTVTEIAALPDTVFGFSQLIIAKVTGMFALGLTSLFFGTKPLKYLKKWWPDTFAMPSPNPQSDRHHSHSHPGDSVTDSFGVSLALCFGGGVLLCTTLLHVQPEVRENVQQLQADGQLFPGFEYMADLLFCLGFFMIIGVDQLVHDILNIWNNKKIDHRSVDGRGETNDATQLDQVTTVAPGEENGRESHHSKNGNVEKGEEFTSSGEDEDPVRGLFTVLALSVHELFEGMTIGLGKRHEDVWLLILSVATHKLVIAFCIGLELSFTGIKESTRTLYVGTFSMVTPVGIAIGISIYNYSLGPMAVFLQGLAAGTLMYAVFFEVLGKHKKPGWCHILAILVGFGSLLFVQFLTPHHHHHGGGHGHSHSHSHGPGFDQHDHSEHHHPEIQFEEHTHSHGNDEHGHEHHAHGDHTHDDYTHDHHVHDDHNHDHHDHDHHDHDHHGH